MTDELDPHLLGPAARDPQAWLTAFRAHAEDLIRQGEAAQEALAANEVTVENKLMRMTLSSGNSIKEIIFLQDASRASSSELTMSFRELYAKGGAQVSQGTRSVLVGLAGEDDPSLEAFDRQTPEDVKLAMEESR